MAKVLVQKFGGTSIGDLEKILAVAKKVKAFYDSGCQIVVIVSAMAGETDRLLRLAAPMQAISQEITPSLRELDALLSTGEQMSSALLAMALCRLGCKASSLNGYQVGIKTDNHHTKARIQSIEAQPIIDRLNNGEIVVVAGFQGAANDGSITTLGRGGSDTTAVALAVAIGADECQILYRCGRCIHNRPTYCRRCKEARVHHV